MSDDLSTLVKASDPGEALKSLGGTYTCSDAEGNELMDRLPQVSMPTGKDPTPFVLKTPTPSTQR